MRWPARLLQRCREVIHTAAQAGNLLLDLRQVCSKLGHAPSELEQHAHDLIRNRRTWASFWKERLWETAGATSLVLARAKPRRAFPTGNHCKSAADTADIL